MSKLFMKKRPTYPHRWRLLCAHSVRAGDHVRFVGSDWSFKVAHAVRGGMMVRWFYFDVTLIRMAFNVYHRTRVLVKYPRP
jgi:hypothetical protein